jgi:hypothetical protein
MEGAIKEGGETGERVAMRSSARTWFVSYVEGMGQQMEGRWMDVGMGRGCAAEEEDVVEGNKEEEGDDDDDERIAYFKGTHKHIDKLLIISLYLFLALSNVLSLFSAI